MNQPIGFQCFEIFPNLMEDWKGTWSKMAGFGYKFVDLVQFFGPLAKWTAKDIRQALDAVGLSCSNCHFSFQNLTDTLGATATSAHELGLKSVVCFPGPRRETLDDWKWMADQLNAIGANVLREGLFLGYHNHEIEFLDIDGHVPYDILMANTDPALVRFQIDVGNLTFAGKDAMSYLTRYSHRYFSLHAKDFAPGKASVPVGKGILDWKSIFELSTRAGIANYVAEVGAYNADTLSETLEPSPLDVLESFRQSYTFLHDFKIEAASQPSPPDAGGMSGPAIDRKGVLVP